MTSCVTWLLVSETLKGS